VSWWSDKSWIVIDFNNQEQILTMLILILITWCRLIQIHLTYCAVLYQYKYYFSVCCVMSYQYKLHCLSQYTVSNQHLISIKNQIKISEYTILFVSVCTSNINKINNLFTFVILDRITCNCLWLKQELYKFTLTIFKDWLWALFTVIAKHKWIENCL